MHRTCKVVAYDMLDQVVVTVSLQDWDGTTVPPDRYEEFSCATAFKSTGEALPEEWVKDALVALIECL